MLKTVTVTTAAALFALSSLAIAADTSKATGAASPSASQSSFSAVDTNNDGTISRAEWDAHFNKSTSSPSSGSTSSPSGTSGSSSGPMGSGSSDSATTPKSPTAPSTGGSTGGGSSSGTQSK